MRSRAMPTSGCKAIFLPKLADGPWSGTMCLTEPQCGTDLGLIRTRAEPADDGSYRVTGTKIFISAGEHDLTENIVHLVLAPSCPTPPPAHAASACSSCPSSCRRGRRLALRRAQRRPLRRHRAQDGHPGLVHLHHAVRGRHGLAGGRAAPGHGRDVHHDERRPPGRRHAGPGAAEARLPERRGLRPRAAAGPLAAGAQCPDQPADPIIVHPDVRRMLLTMQGLQRGRPRARLLGRPALDLAASATPIRPSGRRPTTSSPDDADRQGLPHRPRLRRHQSRHAGVRRPRLHPRIGHGAVGPRRPHRPDLRGRQRHPGPRPGRPQAAGQHRPLCALLPSGGGLPGAAPDTGLAEFAMPLAKAFAKLQQTTLESRGRA